MEMKQLQTFKVLAGELNFTRAAERLNYAQSSVTTQIQGLEQEFGVKLFERLGKRIRLTDAGERLLFYTDRILRLAEEAHLAVSGTAEPRGTLRIVAAESSYTYRLAPVLMKFRSLYPNVNLLLQTGNCSDSRHKVAQGELDLAFTLEETGHDEALMCDVLIQEPMLVLTRPDHPLLNKDRVYPADLAGETILVTDPGSYRAMFEQALEAASAQNRKVEFASIEAIKQCVIAGLGITLLPKMAVKSELSQGLLAALPWAGPEFPVFTQMVWHKDKWLSPALKAFIEVTREQLSN